MRVLPATKPFHRHRFGTLWSGSTNGGPSNAELIGGVGLFLLASISTATISSRDPLLSWVYCLGIFLLGGYWGFRDLRGRRNRSLGGGLTFAGVALALISVWGFLQLAAGATVYRYASWDASVRTAALGATAWVAAHVLSKESSALKFLRAFAWFGFAVSVVSVAAYFTSPGRVLWIFASPYPDVWGPFLSRNDFAGFLELSFPVALWLGFNTAARPARYRMPLWVAAWMLAAGLASASRAGALLLVAEAILLTVKLPQRREVLRFGVWAAALIAIAGAGTLLDRFREPDPLRYRRDIAVSTMAMVAEHPWKGFGLGTYSHVYPAYARMDAGKIVEHAHNTWLEWAAEGGIPFALAWLTLGLSVVGPARRSLWGIGVLAALLHALVDYPFARFGLTAWNFALIGALRAAGVREVRQRLH